MLSAFFFGAMMAIAKASFIGGVAEHSVYMGDGTESVASLISLNLDIYERHIAVASNFGTQILVFPEFGLMPSTIDNIDRTLVGEVAEVIPNEMGVFVPCNNEEFHDRPILYRASCAAKLYGMSVLVNMVDWVDCNYESDANCPSDQHYQYNTDVVFDEQGILVVKYHKSHEWPSLKPAYDQPLQPSEVVYKASFGVNFGLFICFDIMFPDPAKKLVDQGISYFLYAVAQGILGEKTIISHFSLHNSVTMLSSNLPMNDLIHDCSGIIVNGTTLNAKKIYLGDGYPAKENVLVSVIE